MAHLRGADIRRKGVQRGDPNGTMPKFYTGENLTNKVENLDHRTFIGYHQC